MNDAIAEIRKALTATEVFAPCTPRQRARLAEAATVRELGSRQLLYRWGRHARELAVVISGSLEIGRSPQGRGPIAYRRIAPTEIVGLSVMAGEAHTANVKALGRTRVALVPARAVEALIRDDPRVALRMIASLGQLVGDLSDELWAQRTLDLPSRLLHWLRKNADAGRRVLVTHAQLAAHVGAERANVSRALARLEVDGVLVRGRGEITLR